MTKGEKAAYKRPELPIRKVMVDDRFARQTTNRSGFTKSPGFESLPLRFIPPGKTLGATTETPTRWGFPFCFLRPEGAPFSARSMQIDANCDI